MTTDNLAQIDFWNTDGGKRWTDEQAYLDALLAPHGKAVLAAAAAAPGERVIDIGCGCGDSVLALGPAVGASGHVLGVDVSAQMLARAEARAREARLTNVRFALDDAATAALPAGCDLLFSRFGVMFFADPTAAFIHIRAALKPGGRLAFVCWRAPADNPWMLVPVMAARKALGVTPPPADPYAPGPFAFADADRLRAILSDAGFSAIAIAPLDAAMRIGADAAEAAVRSTQVGPLSALVRETGGAGMDTLLAAVAEAIAPYATPAGVMMSGATWVVTAVSP